MKRRKKDRATKAYILPVSADIPDPRYAPCPDPLGFMRSARHHTTRGRSKAERYIDRYWFVPVEDERDYRYLAKNGYIPARKAVIYPAFLPKGRASKPVSERTCTECGHAFTAKRKDAGTCGPACRKASSRRNGVTDKLQNAT